MTFVDRFISKDFEVAQTELSERLALLERRIDAVPDNELVDGNWYDGEIAEDEEIIINPNWVTVSDPRGISNGRFQVAAIVSEEFTEDENPYARSVVLMGRPLGSNNDNDFRHIGHLLPGRYDGDPPVLLMSIRGDMDSLQSTSWESADAAIFLKLIEQTLPEVEEEQDPFDDFGG